MLNYILSQNWSQPAITVPGSLEEKSGSGVLRDTSEQLKDGPEGFRKTLYPLSCGGLAL
jgi:hypothetical protein